MKGMAIENFHIVLTRTKKAGVAIWTFAQEFTVRLHTHTQVCICLRVRTHAHTKPAPWPLRVNKSFINKSLWMVVINIAKKNKKYRWRVSFTFWSSTQLVPVWQIGKLRLTSERLDCVFPFIAAHHHVTQTMSKWQQQRKKQNTIGRIHEWMNACAEVTRPDRFMGAYAFFFLSHCMCCCSMRLSSRLIITEKSIAF